MSSSGKTTLSIYCKVVSIINIYSGNIGQIQEVVFRSLLVCIMFKEVRGEHEKSKREEKEVGNYVTIGLLIF